MGQQYCATVVLDSAMGQCYGATLWGDAMGQLYRAMLWGDAMG